MNEKDKKMYKLTLPEILRFVAPGTPIREGIENVLRAKTGGLIVVGFNEKVKQMVDGGFYINTPFSAAHLYELAKMDGAIILSDTGSKILYANAQLMPDPKTPSSETGMRHRTAERVARQSGCLVIAISQRRNVITLYYGDFHYALRDIGVILTKANQAIQTLEKYNSVLDQSIQQLNALELEDIVTMDDVIQVLHRIEMVLRIKSEINTYVNELGAEGQLIRLQMAELLSNIEDEAALLIKDYCKEYVQNPSSIVKQLQSLSNRELLDDIVLLKLLGFNYSNSLDTQMTPRGFRLLHKIPKLPPLVIENLVLSFKNLKLISSASVEQLDDVDGIGEVRANKIKEGLKRLQEQFCVNRHLS
ncbi:DNA integrity scanning diadenylate cyclase DisA [Bacillus sp. FJAT-47783]|uniref:DNA integrity scanning diadenylate cyclase DisA n=1 Tax=Bacillus sp. FJAT-47783 TaxID=2922712 RepID=UPI001FAE66CC|nr:DNA integrity scanning diadenylate cyclase DisA [Bacillus sp. FJAT-47783]